MPTGFPDYYGGLTLPVTVPEGGTGYTSIDAHALLVGNGTDKMNLIEPSTLGYLLAAQGVGADPLWAPLSAASLVAGAGISISGSPPTITNTDDVYFSAGVLAIAHGGTGTATPALVAGANILISGSWPDQTIALAASPSVTDLTVGGTAKINTAEFGNTSTPGAVVELWNTYTPTQPSLLFHYNDGNDYDLAIQPRVVSTAHVGYDFRLQDDGGGYTTILTLDYQGLSLQYPLGTAYGGTGAASFLAAGLPVQVYVSLNNHITTTGTYQYSVPAGQGGLYRVDLYAAVVNAATLQVQATVTAEDPNDLFQRDQVLFAPATGVAYSRYSGVAVVNAPQSTTITATLSYVSGSGDTYVSVYMERIA